MLSRRRTSSGMDNACDSSGADGGERRLRLEASGGEGAERLSSAEANRQRRLEAVVGRAARRHAEVAERAEAMRARERRLADRLARHLAAAEQARERRLAQTAARAGQAFARAREAAAERKLRTEIEASQRRLELLQRLERAERARQESLAARAAGRARGAAPTPEPFLPRHATRRAALRRQSSSRKLQAAWRTFCEQRQTTRALAQAFAGTGVAFTVPLQELEVGPQPQPTGATPHGASAEPTPAGTPDPCGSPTSTVRRHDGRLASAPQSIPQTPHTTPHRTPAPSAAGSPTRRAAAAGPATPGLAMPPLRSIASPAPAHGAAAAEPAGGFERLAAAISAPATLKAVQALLGRLEARLSVKGLGAGCVAGPMRRLFPRAPAGRALERYPPRVFLCAYMILAHPEVVFNVRGEREAALAAAARAMLAAFEPLLARLAEAAPPRSRSTAASSDAGAEEEAETEDEGAAMPAPLSAMLQLFDEAWVAYLEQFAAWKSADAAGLEAELVRVAVELETSRLAKLAGAAASPARRRSPEDMEALAAAVDRDLRLIGERVGRLSGAQGLARLSAALAAARAAAAAQLPSQDAEPGSEPGSPAAPSPLSRSPSQSPIKKAPRAAGQYTGSISAAPAAAPGEAAAAAPRLLRRSSSAASAVSMSHSAAGEAVDVDGGLAAQPNLALAWHLVYDPHWQLPTEEAEAAWGDALGQTDPMAEPAPTPEDMAAAGPAAALAGAQRRIKRIAERAFWDGIQERLAGGAGADAEAAAAAVQQVAGVLADLGSQLREVLPAGAGEAGAEAAARLDRQRLLEELAAPGGAGVNLPALLGLLEWSAALLARWGAPARDAAAATAQAAVRQQLAAAGNDAAAAAAAATRALRLLCVQLRMLRLDAANAHLRLLAAQLRAEGAAAYAASKWEAVLGPAGGAVSAEELGARLPHARAWLAAASGQLPHVEQLEALSGGLSTPAAAQQALPHMRAGLRAAPTAGGSAGAEARGPQLQRPMEARSWRGLVRLGLVQLVSGEGAVARLPLPETLRLDAGRLHAAQGDCQRLLVTATCLLLVRQAAAAAGQAFGAPQVGLAKARLAALLGDGSARLPDIAAECARLAGAPVGGEAAMQASLQRMLTRGAGALKALTGGLTEALLTLLLRDASDAGAQAHVSLALRRCGAADLAGEVAALASDLGAVAAAGEAACRAWYAALAADLL